MNAYEEGRVDGPPVDDVCPICFGEYTIPCKSNCGHWFCAGCILQWWDFGAVVQHCKCPLCYCKISKLTPKKSVLVQREEDVAKIIKRVRSYNSMYGGGLQSLLLKIIVLLLSMTKRVLTQLMGPHNFRINHYVLRYFAVTLTGLYKMYKLDFIPTGGLQVGQLFELRAVILAIMVCLVGFCFRVMQSRYVVHLGAAQP